MGTEGKRLKTTQEDRHHIPNEIVHDIFLGLPVKTVLRFKSVSKNWCKLIEDPSFIIRHLQHSQKHSKSFIGAVFGKNQGIHMKIYVINSEGVADSTRKRPNLLNMASCNGLFCFINLDYKIRVCNPVTKESIWLPKLKLSFGLSREDHRSIVLGLGFDSTLEKYKVVCWDLHDERLVHVLTVGSKSWRSIMQCPYRCKWIHGDLPHGVWCARRVGFPVYVNGSSHWYQRNGILSFNYREEKFGFISFPKECGGRSFRDGSSMISEVGGRICLTRRLAVRKPRDRICLTRRIAVRNKVSDMRVESWILMNYEEKEWVCKEVILPFKDISHAVVLVVRENEILIDTRRTCETREQYLCAYNEESRVTSSLRIDGIQCDPGFSRLDIHSSEIYQSFAESLVSLRQREP